MVWQEFDFHGDTNKQLARAMKAFSSSFARANRRKLLRKHFLAFDVNNTQRISRAQFVDTVNEVGRAGKQALCYCDYFGLCWRYSVSADLA